MTTEQREGWVKRIADMLRMAEHPATSKEEAAAAAAKAAELMMKFNIERAEADRHNNVKSEPYERDNLGKMDSRWNANLAHSVAKSNFCYTVLTNSTDPTRPLITVVGQRSNLDVVKYLYVHLLREIRRMARESYDEAHTYGRDFNDDGKRITSGQWARAFGLGAAAAIYSRLEQQRKQDETTVAGAMDLVVVKGAELSTAVEQMFGKLKQGPKTPRSEAAAWSQGYQAGFQVGMNPGPPKPKKS